MTTDRRLSTLWAIVRLVLACLVVHACSADEEPLTPAGPAAPPDPAAAGVVIRGTVMDVADAPISGAIVSGSGVIATTDAAGAFTASYTGASSHEFLLYAHKIGYISRGRMVFPHSGESVIIKLPAVFGLPMDGSTASELLPADLPGYVGEPYESDYSWNIKYFSFNTPATHDVIVEMSWQQAGTEALAMWALDGRVSSLLSGSAAVLRLPRGRSGFLLVGRTYSAGQLTRPVAFALHTRRADPS